MDILRRYKDEVEVGAFAFETMIALPTSSVGIQISQS
ncbi:hypothetical protein FOXG_21662 [Fusarium oxysporum f. sp. lycopersici 4287]|uniref:Uncharacterized protein n=1 Tax=Fusarium oxysporum f. sp. lycopersici (strain 4287 / CBS 123668 / FGSC 9935 / NRRL 34936) TaxID=426428 RepID=A0A0J9W056_FUSO4|nr:hypothetical protein FOXG_21662 [Fusarium oxysporum f. sp. lycopersici 4287]KNB16401.1 hypothetical protein FOXG_21662 [Fusarium oxysporum f. sp. lycopersici 4287]